MEQLKAEQSEILEPFLNQKKEDYYKPVMIGSAFSNNYIDCENDGVKSKTLTIKEYPEEIKPYLKDINNLEKCDN